MLKEGFLVKRVSALRPRAWPWRQRSGRWLDARARLGSAPAGQPARPAKADPVWLLWFRAGSGVDLLKQLNWG